MICFCQELWRNQKTFHSTTWLSMLLNLCISLLYFSERSRYIEYKFTVLSFLKKDSTQAIRWCICWELFWFVSTILYQYWCRAHFFFFFSVLNAVSWGWSYIQVVPCLVDPSVVWSSLLNSQQICLHVTFLAQTHFLVWSTPFITFTFSGSSQIPSLEIMCPRNFTSLAENGHFSFSVTPAVSILCHTIFTIWSSSFYVLPLTRT